MNKTTFMTDSTLKLLIKPSEGDAYYVSAQVFEQFGGDLKASHQISLPVPSDILRLSLQVIHKHDISLLCDPIKIWRVLDLLRQFPASDTDPLKQHAVSCASGLAPPDVGSREEVAAVLGVAFITRSDLICKEIMRNIVHTTWDLKLCDPDDWSPDCLKMAGVKMVSMLRYIRGAKGDYNVMRDKSIQFNDDGSISIYAMYPSWFARVKTKGQLVHTIA